MWACRLLNRMVQAACIFTAGSRELLGSRVARKHQGIVHEKTMPFFSACLLAFVFAANALAAHQAGQSAVEGRVVDARTGAGLAKVSVVAETSGSTPRIEAQTDGDGRFVLTGLAPGRQRLYVSVVGYILVQRDVDIPASGEPLRLTIPLTEGTGTYTETVTVAGDVFRTVETGIASQHVLGSADIQNLRGVLADDPLRAVQVLPGVATGDDLRSEFSVRGSDFSRMNFTVEGFATPFLLHTVRAIEDRANSGSVAMINSDILEDVALLNGSYAQRHGNRTGAEVDFRLREGSRERRQVRLAVSGTNASAVFEGPFGKSQRGSWLVSARQSYIDLLIKRLAAEGLSFAFRDVQGKAVFDLTPRQRVELTLIAGASRLEDVDPEDPGFRFIGRNRSSIAVAGWRFAGRRAVVTARMLGAHNKFRNDQTDSRDLDEGQTTQVAGRVDVTIPVASVLDVETGVLIDNTNETRLRIRDSPLQTVNDYSGRATRGGVFAQLRWKPFAALTVVPGARADRVEMFENGALRNRLGINPPHRSFGSPWLQTEWKLTNTFALRAGTGIYRQFPDFEQAIGRLGIPTNEHERAVHYDVGVEHRVGTTMRWHVTAYRRDESDFLRRRDAETRVQDGRPVRGLSTAPFVTRLDGRTRGIEVLFERRTPNGLSGWISYAYGRNRYEDQVAAEAFWGDLDQRHTANLYGFYRLSDRTSVTGKIRIGSNFPAPGYYRERDGKYTLIDRRNELRLPLYTRVDLRANRTYTWSRARMTLFAELMNVLNRDNVRISRPRVNLTTREVRNMFEPMIPIVPSAGILIEF